MAFAVLGSLATPHLPVAWLKLALALFLPPLRRRLLPALTLPTPHAPPLLRGLGARGPPILL